MASTSAPARTEPTGGVPKAHRLLALFFLAGGLVQFFLAGLGVFGGTTYDPHAIFGTFLTVVALVILILAAVGRRDALQPSAVLFVLMLVQNVLGAVGNDVPAIGALHPLNGLAILGVASLAAAGSRVRFGPPPHRTA